MYSDSASTNPNLLSVPSLRSTTEYDDIEPAACTLLRRALSSSVRFDSFVSYLWVPCILIIYYGARYGLKPFC